MHSSMGQYRKCFLLHYNLIFSFTRFIQHWQEVRVNGACRTQCDASTIYHTWQMKFAWLWEMITKTPEISCQKSDNPLQLFPAGLIAFCYNRHPETAPEDAKRQWVSTGHDGSLHEVNKSPTDVKTTDLHIFYQQSFRVSFAPFRCLAPSNDGVPPANERESGAAQQHDNRTTAGHYVSENERDWDIYLKPLTYVCNVQVSRLTNLGLFSPVLSHSPPTPPDPLFSTIQKS